MASDKRVLLVDDEPEYLSWLLEFLEIHGAEVELVTTLAEGLRAVERPRHRFAVVDLNIPAVGTVIESVANTGPLATRFPGLLIASRARNAGYREGRVVAYTVHYEAAIEEELERLGCAYVLKGRPQSLKTLIGAALGSKK